MKRLTLLLVRVVLLAHPGEFRRRFREDIVRELDADLARAGAGGTLAMTRAAMTATLDAVLALRAERPPETHDTRGAHMRTWIRDAAHDVRLGLRGFRRQWIFSASVIATLALGIGVNAAMFGVADRLLLTGPEHIRSAAQLRRIQKSFQPPGMNVNTSGLFPFAAYDALRGEARAFDGIAAYNVYENGAILGRGAEARLVNRGEATASLFPLLGVTPALGRFFDAQEDDVVAPQPVVVLGYGLWQRQFGGRRDVIGQAVTIGDTTYTIVGVAPRAFTGADLLRVDVWMPESLLGRERIRPNWAGSWNGWWLSLVVRLKPNVSDEQADAEATAIFRRHYPIATGALATSTLTMRPLLSTRDGLPSMESRVSTWLVGVAAAVLLIACANVVNLMLAHALTRRREIAVRLALGAGRGRLVRLLIAESLALAGAGGLAGLIVAWAIGAAMRAWLIPSVEWPSGPISVRVLVMGTLVSVTVGLVVGLLPALRASASDMSASLKAGVREGGGRRSRARDALTMVQAALCAVLLVGAGLFVASLERVRALDLGIQPDRVLTFSLTRPGVGALADATERGRENDRRAAFYPMATERLRQHPDVEAASLAIGLAFMGAFSEDIRVPGWEKVPQLKGGGPYLSAVTPDFFATVGTPILRGHAFTAADHAGTAPVAVVNETMAATLWPAGDAIGKCFYVEHQAACTGVIGVAADTRHFRLQEDASMSFYIPFGQENGIGGTLLLVRPRGDADRVMAAVRRELLSLDPTITFVNAGSLQDRWDPLVRPWRLGATMFSLMGVLALVVAAGGLYSVMSYFVTQRRHEIGVRMALGARPADVARLVVRGSLVLAAGGIAVGLGVATVAVRVIEPLLFATSPRDPFVFGGVAATLLVMALIATVVPAARARRVNPVEAMRAE